MRKSDFPGSRCFATKIAFCRKNAIAGLSWPGPNCPSSRCFDHFWSNPAQKCHRSPVNKITGAEPIWLLVPLLTKCQKPDIWAPSRNASAKRAQIGPFLPESSLNRDLFTRLVFKKPLFREMTLVIFLHHSAKSALKGTFCRNTPTPRSNFPF